MRSVVQRFGAAAPNNPSRPATDPLTTVACLRSIMSYRRGQTIYGERDPADFWFHLISGAARKYALLADGRRRIVDFLMPGDLFGFGIRDSHFFAAEAITPGTVIACYPRRAMETAADTDPALGRRLREIAFEAIYRSQARVLTTGRVTSLQKVGSFLVEMSHRSFDPVDKTVFLPMSRYDIADYLGLSVETVSRALTEFKHCGAIQFVDPHHVRFNNFRQS
jgi:CRP-like cAMP-binding protein